jgi:hypothetical protein
MTPAACECINARFASAARSAAQLAKLTARYRSYDHVVPPFEGVPNDEAPCNLRDHPGNSNMSCAGSLKQGVGPFDFRRLGLRAAAMLISPWVAKGSFIQEPRGKGNTSQWEHSSIPATVKSLFNLTGFRECSTEHFAYFLGLGRFLTGNVDRLQ